MKKILIFYGSYGGGHLSAAKSISNYLTSQYPSEIEVKMVDCIEYINKYLNKVSTEAYKELAKKAPWIWKQVYQKSKNGALSHISSATNKLMSYKLYQLLQEFNPDLIISTHPFSTQMCATLKKKDKINCKLATILTDYNIHPQWLVLHNYTDYFFVSNEKMKKDMIIEGILDTKIFVTGIPVSDRFSEDFDKDATYKEFGLYPEKPTVLFFAGGEFGLGRNTTYMVLKALIRLFRDLQIVAISGKNKKMNESFKALVESTNSNDRVKILDYTNKVPELMNISMGVITKPGGLTVTEALVSHLPIVVINPIPGQEEENAEFLVENNVAIWIKKEDNIARALKNLSRDIEKMEAMKENAKNLSKPNATSNICNILIDEFDDIIKIPNKMIVSALVKCKNKYLFIKPNKSDNYKIYQDCIDLLSGTLQNNETPEKALERIALEKVNLKLNKFEPYDFDSDIVTYKGRQTQLIFLRYIVEIDEIPEEQININSAKKLFETKNKNEKNILWIEKDKIKNYKYNEPTKRLFNKMSI